MRTCRYRHSHKVISDGCWRQGEFEEYGVVLMRNGLTQHKARYTWNARGAA